MGEHDPTLPQPASLLTSTQQIAAVYGDQIHQNDGIHLDGGVVDDQEWQNRWREVMAPTPQRYDVPTGRVGRLFVADESDELKGVV